MVRKFVGDTAECVLQEPQLGTGHAVLQAESSLKGKTDLVIVTYADMPLLRAETFQQLVETQRLNPGPFSLLTVIADDPRGLADRAKRRRDGAGIVEDMLPAEQRAIKELTSARIAQCRLVVGHSSHRRTAKVNITECIVESPLGICPCRLSSMMICRNVNHHARI
jgi:bifunctional N-acetylglucosamine-1-phosphate-uridyltransferase/glucosamine-1-phosphate-acetyltransferase GlmU-like protein